MFSRLYLPWSLGLIHSNAISALSGSILRRLPFKRQTSRDETRRDEMQVERKAYQTVKVYKTFAFETDGNKIKQKEIGDEILK